MVSITFLTAEKDKNFQLRKKTFPSLDGEHLKKKRRISKGNTLDFKKIEIGNSLKLKNAFEVLKVKFK